MTDNELKICLKSLLFDETADELKTPQDGFNVGSLDNTDLYTGIFSLIQYYKKLANE